ncbi:hypothetical protein CCO03_18965 [Comamonas serinivorans]|uniref:Pilus assembly protein n=1 Tax=Comamonas serinivorans TaxID=1082851 RepID=A0A1Y0ES24_9BURK|nr:hypothetical protein CCO03_18965 [Comamonas serinivorans]
MVAALIAAVVLWVWYPSPYDLLSGGRHLFLILIGVDVVCGPLLTLILFNPAKSRRERWVDVTLVVLIQLTALAYGVHTVYQARPLYLVHERDRFRAVSMADYGDADVRAALAQLPVGLQPQVFKGPFVVGIREPKDSQERQTVMFESVAGGRDYAQRPEFYVPYDASYQAKALARARPLAQFVKRYPKLADRADLLLAKHAVQLGDATFLPVLHKQEWVAVLDAQAHILGFLPGDGFDVR